MQERRRPIRSATTLRGSKDFAWYSGNTDQPRPVGRKSPNPWGLYDMHGNVWEWCWDSFDPYPYKSPRPMAFVDDARVLRGGSFIYAARNLRSAYRGWSLPTLSKEIIGFRCVRGSRRRP